MDQALVECTAQRMISSGMAAAGYRYMNIDDYWMAPLTRSPGRLRADPDRISAPHSALTRSPHAGTATDPGTGTRGAHRG